LRAIAFKAPQGLEADLDWISLATMSNRSAVIRRALKEALDYVRKYGKLPKTSYVPYGGDKNLRLFTIRVEEDLVRELEVIAREHGLSKSEVVRRAIYHHIEVEGRKYRPYRGKYVRIYYGGLRSLW
jgi:predicted transcriptional regulator